MHFAHPKILWLLLVLIPLIVWYLMKQRNSRPSLSLSSTSAFAAMHNSFRSYLLHIPFALKMAAIACMIVALARPQTRNAWNTSQVEGTDIVLAMDISSSMLARDFSPNRMEAAKKVASAFVNGRENDNIGVVIFAGESLTGVPMTSDRATVVNYINGINENMLEDGTAIGDGLATAINRIKNGKAKSKSIILLTDGSNNTGVVPPLTAAEIAKGYGIKVYTIGVGTNGTAPYPQVDYFGRISYAPMPVVIDENTLRQIADKTGGKYFRAVGNRVLEEIFHEIDGLEKSVLDVKNFSHTEDDYFIWALIACGLIALEILLRNTLLRTIP
jgi:Ca-activated chloride channel family protein